MSARPALGALAVALENAEEELAAQWGRGKRTPAQRLLLRRLRKLHHASVRPVMDAEKPSRVPAPPESTEP